MIGWLRRHYSNKRTFCLRSTRVERNHSCFSSTVFLRLDSKESHSVRREFGSRNFFFLAIPSLKSSKKSRAFSQNFDFLMPFDASSCGTETEKEKIVNNFKSVRIYKTKILKNANFSKAIQVAGQLLVSVENTSQVDSKNRQSR